MDTWATSSMTPQIVGQWLADDSSFYEQVYPFSLRPQAHEIIRTWAFYTIVKSHYHFDALPWTNILISGWGLAGEGMGKISKSRGGGLMGPLEMIERYSADAVRYWAASTGSGKDSVISEEKIQLGMKLVTKLWNVARFCEPFMLYSDEGEDEPSLTGADRWILSRTQRLIRRVTHLMQSYDYAAAKSEIEQFFWLSLADNYLEMCKQRLYNPEHDQRNGARSTLTEVLLTTIKLFAPFLPFITEEIYQGLFTRENAPEQLSPGRGSIHTSWWPSPQAELESDGAEAFGERLVEIASAVRRYKSEHNLSLGNELRRLQLATRDLSLAELLFTAKPDLSSVCRAQQVELVSELDPRLNLLPLEGSIQIAIEA